MWNFDVVKMLDLMRRAHRVQRLEHGKLAASVAIPCSAAALGAIPAQLQSPPPLLIVIRNPTSHLESC